MIPRLMSQDERQTTAPYRLSPPLLSGMSSQGGSASQTPNLTCTTCSLSLSTSPSGTSPPRPTIVIDWSFAPREARLSAIVTRYLPWNRDGNSMYRTSSSTDPFFPGSRARTKGWWRESIKMRVRRSFAEARVLKIGHSSILAGPEYLYPLVASVWVVERNGSRDWRIW